MAEGYIKLYRQIVENEFWKEKPYSRAQAWVDLLLKANFKETKTVIKGRVVILQRGQLLRGVDNLAEEWGWSRGKVRRFLDTLNRQGMAHSNGTPNGTLITIEKYTFYQDARPQDDTANGTPDGTPDGTRYKNVKNVKNVKKRGDFAPPAREEVSKYVKEMGYKMDPDAFYDYYSGVEWIRKNGQPIKDWKASARMWEYREKQFGGGESEKKATEPPKYKEFEKEPDIKAEPPTPKQRAEMKKKLIG